MIPKRTLIMALAGLNLFLLASILFYSYSLPTAFAQRSGASGNFVAVTARADIDYDAMYLLDLAGRKLHCFIPTRDQTGNVQWAGVRDLERDFDR